jgi:hypothetical protein
MDDTDQSVKMGDMDQSVKMDDTDQSVKMGDMDQSVKMDDTDQSVKMDDTDQSVKMGDMDQSVKMDDMECYGQRRLACQDRGFCRFTWSDPPDASVDSLGVPSTPPERQLQIPLPGQQTRQPPPLRPILRPLLRPFASASRSSITRCRSRNGR